MGSTTLLTSGRRFAIGDETYRVVTFTLGGVVCRSDSNGSDLCIAPVDLLNLDGFRFVDEPDDAEVEALDFDIEQLALRCGAQVKSEAIWLYQHLLEAFTGFKSGHAELALPNEPRDQYNPTWTTQKQRLVTKSGELKDWARRNGREDWLRRCGPSSLRRYWRNYTLVGLSALVDGRKLRGHDPLAGCPVELVEAIVAVRADLMRRSGDHTWADRRRYVTEYLRESAKKADEEHANSGEAAKDGSKPERITEAPPEKRFKRYWNELTRARSTGGSMRYQRSRFDGPDTPYAPIPATYPGQYVFIDTHDSDLFVWDFSQERQAWVAVKLKILIAMDVFSASIVGTRLVIGEPDQMDAVALLRDIVTPKVWREEWGESGRWNYLGIPRHFVVEVGDFEIEADDLGGIPIVRPGMVVSDNAWIFEKSWAFKRGVETLHATLQYCRSLHPTDKARLERFFGTAKEFWRDLPGYTGSSVHTKAENGEADAYYFFEEVEEMWLRWVVTKWQVFKQDGLWPAGHPHEKLSPNRTYEMGVAKVGFVSVPARRDLLVRLLPQELCTIQRDGIRLKNMKYDCPEGELQKRGLIRKTSPYPQYGGKWPVRWNPHDRRYIYLLDPKTREWLRLTWRGLRYTELPLADAEVEYLRADLIGRTRRVDERELEQAINEYLARRHVMEIEGRGELRKAARLAQRKQRAAQDHAEIAATLPPASTPSAQLPPLPDEQFGDEAQDAASLFLTDVTQIRRLGALGDDDTEDDDDDAGLPAQLTRNPEVLEASPDA